MIEHIQRVRAVDPYMRNATAVIALESNLGFEAQHLLHALNESKLSKWIALAEGPGGSIGLHTTAERKEQYCLLLREVLKQDRIAFNDNFFSISMDPKEAKQRLRDELGNFCVIVEAPKTTFGKTRKTCQPPRIDPVPPCRT